MWTTQRTNVCRLSYFSEVHQSVKSEKVKIKVKRHQRIVIMDELMLQRQRDLNDLDFDTDLVIVDKDGTPMKDFYEGKHIFLTGVTGFFGQLYLQKLMR